MARLVAAQCPSCGAAVKVDPGQEVVNCSYCGTSSFVRTKPLFGRAPAAPPSPKADATTSAAAAEPQQVIEVANPNRVLALIVGITVLAVGICLAVAFAVAGTDDLHRDGDALADAAAQLRSGLGRDAKLRRLLVYPEFLSVQAQRADEPGKLAEYMLRGGSLSDPKPVSLSGSQQEELEERLFPLSSVKLDAVHRIVAHAQKQHGAGNLSVVMLEKRLPRSNELLWWASVKGLDTNVGYDLAGAPLLEGPVDLLRDATSIRKKLTSHFGAELRLREMVLMRDHAVVEVQVPKKKAYIDRYILSNGTISAPDPTRVTGTDKEQLDAKLFGLKEIDFSIIPKVAADAQSRLAIDQSEVTSMIFRRHAAGLGWHVYVRSKRENGWVEYDATGKMLAAHPP